MRKMRNWFAVLGIGISVLTTTVVWTDNIEFAATEPTYELTNETAEVDAYEGEVWTDELNVRTGFGAY